MKCFALLFSHLELTAAIRANTAMMASKKEGIGKTDPALLVSYLTRVED